MAELSVMGKAVYRIDALEKVTGRAKYSSDFKLAGMLHAKVVKSPYAHARILGIDASRAEKLAGVRAVVLPEDAPERRLGYEFLDEYVLPRDNLVRCVGQPVAVVVADTPEIAEEAVDLVEVDYDELPAMFDAEEAISENPPVIVHPDMKDYVAIVFPFSFDPALPNCYQHFKIRKGDVGKGFDESDLVVENRYSTARISHCYSSPGASMHG